MRDAEKPASLGELLGKCAEKKVLGFDDLPEILGEKMPDIPLNRIGKFRLVSALQQRFGPGYKSIPMVGNIIKEFDERAEIENIVRRNKGGK